MREQAVAAASLDRLAALLPGDRAARLARAAERARRNFGDRTVWHVSSTASGGGVVELLRALLGYANGAGVENRWLVLDAEPDFFAITKRIHNMLHGEAGDGDPLGDAERRRWMAVLDGNASDLLQRVRPGDIVVLHDPQTAGLAAHAHRAGACVVWRCHIGHDGVNPFTERAWEFLRPHLREVDALVFSRRAYAPPWLARDRIAVIPPSIDPFSTKNRLLPPDDVLAVLARVGLVDATGPGAVEGVERGAGATGGVRPHRDAGGLVLDGPAPPAQAPLVVQVSRWDRLKDMAGVMDGFALMVQDHPRGSAHLMLLGPHTSGVADDPEGAAVLAECRARWRTLPDLVRRRVHLASVPMDDPHENAIIVNAVQRHASVVVQKSLAEGFGLTVTEAMWKARPVLASRVGGIQDQITHGREGLLLNDPRDHHAFAVALRRLLVDGALAHRLGASAHTRVLDQYVGDRHLVRYVGLFSRLVAGSTR